MAKIYDDFGDIEEEVRKKVPPTIFKYREWGNPFHRKILLDRQLWFSHPKDLNDPYDIRVPVTFDYSEVDHPEFLKRLKYHTENEFPSIHPGSREFSVIVENQLDIIRDNVGTFFENNYKQIRESNLYDQIGVLSFSETCLDETMWAHYGRNGEGIAIGFDTVELARQLNVKFGMVDYDEKPPLHSFIRSNEDNIHDETFLKHSKWASEKEFRFLTYGILTAKDRMRDFQPNTIVEVVLGRNISDTDRDELKDVLKVQYHGRVNLFQVKESETHFEFDKVAVPYT